ncbi:MAG: sigma-70 family RNA polymerase sigma factor [Hyphomicrobiales bacterium]|nr:MAG: sigma-70 family RNA polymerase sigma factor [Hyphomicrobiales bacterium]
MIELLAAIAAKADQRKSESQRIKADLIATMPSLRRYAFSLCGHREKADDLVQETMVKALSNLSSFQRDTDLRAWLFTILRNSFVSDIRKRKREVEDAGGKIAESVSIAPPQQARVELADMLEALDRLPPVQREAVLLVGAGGLSYDEAAEVANCAVGTIKSRVNRARAALNAQFGLGEADPLPNAG